jgi:hypothetical protein
MKQRVRELLRASPFKPFVVRTADGKEFKVEHPDFVLAAGSDTPNVILEDPTGEVHFISALLITSVGVLAEA